MMIDLTGLTPAERGKHLAFPEGDIGLAVAEVLNTVNFVEYQNVLALMALAPSSRVLEIGFGNGHLLPEVLRQAPDIRYAGIDISPTMVDEALKFNSQAVANGQASFVLGSAENMPFGDSSFDHVFAIGVKHFWAEPAASLAEIRRVLRPGGLCIMSSIHPIWAPSLPFARQEFGFHFRDNKAWERLHAEANFASAAATTVEFPIKNADGSDAKGYGLRVIATA
jgi:ubiquinone/menaquinone biosynthesis C-methylase UbiE